MSLLLTDLLTLFLLSIFHCNTSPNETATIIPIKINSLAPARFDCFAVIFVANATKNLAGRTNAQYKISIIFVCNQDCTQIIEILYMAKLFIPRCLNIAVIHIQLSYFDFHNIPSNLLLL